MDIRHLASGLSISGQIHPDQMSEIKTSGFRAIICNRPDGEGSDQPLFADIQRAAQAMGIEAHYLAAESGKVTDEQGVAFGKLFESLPKPVLAYCRSGMRSTTMWALSQAGQQPLPRIVETASKAGFDMKGVIRRIANEGRTPVGVAEARHAVVIVGAGAAGIAAASSLLAREPGLDIAIIDPADVHYYQPGWTLVGGGVFDAHRTAHTMGATIPRGVHWIKAAVAAFEPENDAIILDGCRVVRYEQLIVCPGLKLDWHAIEGLPQTLGRNGVTSNYLYHLAPYTWEQVQQLRSGRAIFTQPPMPIKCAGAPQKAMYLCADHWRRQGGTRRYRDRLLQRRDSPVWRSRLRASLDGVRPRLWDRPEFRQYADVCRWTGTNGDLQVRQGRWQYAPGDARLRPAACGAPSGSAGFYPRKPLADGAGWIDVDPDSLRHKAWANIHALGDATNTSNAKTAAAARKQAPVVAHNVLAAMGKAKGSAHYDGYGSCPLTVERGKVVLAEFTYGGKLAPSFPSWLIDGTRPSWLAWLLKERILPPLYWKAMLKGREWLAKPELADL